MEDATPGRTLRALLLLAAGAIAVALFHANRDFFHDDAYITLRYARNLVAGLGPVWNPGERVQGFTSVLHLMLVSALGGLGLDLVAASRLIGLASYAGVVGVVAACARPLAAAGDATTRAAAALLAATAAPLIVWSLGGLESPLYALLAAGSAGLVVRAAATPEPRPGPAALAGWVSGLSVLARPDGAVLVVVSAAWLATSTWRGPRRSATLLAFGLGVGMVLAPCLAWQVAYFGDWVPNTALAKVGTPWSLRLETGLRYSVAYLLAPPFLPALSALALGLVWRCGRWTAELTYLAALCVAHVLYVIAAGGDHMPAFRFMVPLVPWLSVTLALAAVRLAPGRRLRAGLAAGAVLLSALQLRSGSLNPGTDDAAYLGETVGRYIDQAWPPGSLVALNTAGSTPYFARSHLFIDMLGLNDRTIARRRIDRIELPWQRVPGHLKGDGAYVLSRRPDFIVLGPAHGTEARWPWFLSDLELARDPRFLAEYEGLRVMLPNRRGAARTTFPFTYYRRVGAPTAR